MKITSRFPLTNCPDCLSEHIGGPCGMTFAERLKSVRLATEWMPAKASSRTETRDDGTGVQRSEKDYYDDSAITEMFGDGLTGKERKEQMLEETQGVGIATAEDIRKHPELVAAHYLDNPRNELVHAD